MSVNPTLKHNNVKYVSTSTALPETNSILSDDQSSYVLFNPVSEDSDILSFTNTTESHNLPDNELIDDVDSIIAEGNEWDAPEGYYETENNSYDSLSIKIHKWNMSADVSELVDDNTASWNLDEKLTTDSLLHKEFYGDELFKDFNKDDFNRFRKFHFEDMLKVKDRNLANQMLIKFLIDNGELQKQKQVGYYEMSSTVRDYISNFNNNVEVSDTNSSLILC